MSQKKTLVEVVAEQTQTPVEEQTPAPTQPTATKQIIKVSTLDGLTRAEIKSYLDSLGIEYKSNATQAKLIQLLSPHVEFETDL